MKHFYRWLLCAGILLALSTLVHAQICYDCGDGRSGELRVLRDTVLASGTYQFSEVYIADGAVVRFAGSAPVILRCKNTMIIDGTLSVSGSNGGDGTANLTIPVAGSGNAGGYHGAAGITAGTFGAGTAGDGPGGGNGSQYGGGLGGGYGSSIMHCNTLSGGSTYGDSLLSAPLGGSGGGSGAALAGSVSGAGGGGGGVLVLSVCEVLTIGTTGKIIAYGGNGGNAFLKAGGGGGGAGGSIFITAQSLHNDGLIAATGGEGGRCLSDSNCALQGGRGGDGRIRVDYSNLTGTGAIRPGYFEKKLFDAGISRVVDARCANTATGFIRARASGGEKPYRFQWSNGSTGNEINQLPKGTYTVTITDATGCSVTEQASVVEPSPLHLSVSTYPPACLQKNDGVALYHVEGGTQFPFKNTLSTTKWSNTAANGLLFTFQCKTTIDLNQLMIHFAQAGSQRIEVFYRPGNSANFAFAPGQWQKITSLNFITPINGDEYEIDLSALSGLTAGNHSLYVYSYNSPLLGISSKVLGSTFNFDHLVDLFAGMARGQSTQPFAAQNTGVMNLSGRLTYSVKSPTGASYLFLNNGLTGPEQSGLAPGNHTVVVTDALGCSTSGNFNMAAREPVNIQQTVVTPPLCASARDGRIALNIQTTDAEGFATTAIPFSMPYQGVYLQFSNSEEIRLSGIDLYTTGPGQISLYIRRGSYKNNTSAVSGWTHIGNFTLPAPDARRISNVLLPSPILLDPDQWSLRIETDQTLIHLLPQRSNFLQAGLLHLNSSGFQWQGTFGSTTLVPGTYFSGSLRYMQGSGSLQYQWNNAATNATSFSGLPAGNYTFTVQYLQSCSTSANITLQEPDPIRVNAQVTPEKEQKKNGQITLIVNGGTSPYFISWPQQAATGPLLQELEEGCYPVFIADANGCIFRDSIRVGRSVSPVQEQGILTLVPNPGVGYIKIGNEVKGMENCTLRIFDMLGRLTFEEGTTISALRTTGLDLHHYGDGTYVIQVSDDDQVFQARAMIIR